MHIVTPHPMGVNEYLAEELVPLTVTALDCATTVIGDVHS